VRKGHEVDGDETGKRARGGRCNKNVDEERAVTGGQQAEEKEKYMKATTRSMTRSNEGESTARTFSSRSSI
jgi:hypothetical protein